MHTPHTAHLHTPEKTLDGANARPRAGAREVSAPTVHPQAECAPDDKLTVSDLLADAADHMGPALGWISGTFTPPDVWSQDRPSLSKLWAYASRGDWTTDTGAPRRAGQAYAALFAFPLTAFAYFAAWVAERPSRLAAATALVVLITQFPPLSWLV